MKSITKAFFILAFLSILSITNASSQWISLEGTAAWDVGLNMTLGDDGNIWVATQLGNFPIPEPWGSTAAAVAVAISPNDGSWINKNNPPFFYSKDQSYYSYANSISVDGGVTIAGNFYNGVLSQAVIGLRKDGIAWENHYGGTDGYDVGKGVLFLKKNKKYLASVIDYTSTTDRTSFQNGNIRLQILDRVDGGVLKYSIDGGAGDGRDIPNGLIEALDGGLVVFGGTTSNSGDFINKINGKQDGFFMSYDYTYSSPVAYVYGGSGDDFINSVIATANGDYYAVGTTDSRNIEKNQGAIAGESDFWIMRIDKNFNIVWSRTLGSATNDYATGIVQLSHGQFAVVGNTAQGVKGQSDAVLIKIDTSGNILWQQQYGGSQNDYALSIIKTNTDHVVFGGYSLSQQIENQISHGDRDVWIQDVGLLPPATLVVSKNSVLLDNRNLSATVNLNTINSDDTVTLQVQSSSGRYKVTTSSTKLYGQSPTNASLLTLEVITPLSDGIDTITITSNATNTVEKIVVNTTTLSVSQENQAVAVATSYPNPTSGEFKVSIPTSSGFIHSAECISVTGAVVKRWTENELQINNETLQLNIQGLPQGMYFLRVLGSQKNIVTQIMLSE